MPRKKQPRPEMTTEELIRTILPKGVVEKLDREIKRQDGEEEPPEKPEKSGRPVSTKAG